MIRIDTHRIGPVVVAVNVNDHWRTAVAIGLTDNSARMRLIRKVT